VKTVTKSEALDLLVQVVTKDFDADELCEIQNELFPAAPVSLGAARADPNSAIGPIIGYIRSGLEVDEIVDLWELLLPRHQVWYDEEEDRFHYTDQPHPISAD
jgi:hypothetical protein